MPVGKAIARSISVGGATEKRVRKPCNIDEQRLERSDRAWPHAATGRGVERVSTKILNGRETQGIDRRLGDEPVLEEAGPSKDNRKSDFTPPVSEPL